MWNRRVAAAALRGIAATGPRGTRRAVELASRLPDSWHRGEVVDARVGGFDLTLQLDDNVQRELYYLGAYERPFVDFLVGELRAGDVVLDVGAHVGIFSLPLGRRLRELGDGRLVAVEASPSTAARLRDHLERNGLGDVTVLAAALTAEACDIELRSDPLFGTGDSAVRSRYGTGEVVETVPGIPFDAWAEREGLDRLDVVKLDIEGAELEALEGMRATLRRLRPRIVTVEVKGYVMERVGAPAEAVDELMREVGYARRPPLSRLLGVRGGLPHVDDNVVFAPEDR